MKSIIIFCFLLLWLSVWNLFSVRVADEGKIALHYVIFCRHIDAFDWIDGKNVPIHFIDVFHAILFHLWVEPKPNNKAKK